jgi:hypothetical protein
MVILLRMGKVNLFKLIVLSLYDCCQESAVSCHALDAAASHLLILVLLTVGEVMRTIRFPPIRDDYYELMTHVSCGTDACVDWIFLSFPTLFVED